MSSDINFDSENGLSGLFGLIGNKNNSNINNNVKQLFKDLENPYLSSMNLEDLLSYVDGIDGCSDALKNFLKTTEPAERNLSNFKAYLKETGQAGSEFADGIANGATKALGLLKNIGLSLVNGAITWAISAGIEQLYKASQAMDELRQSSQEYGSQFASIKTDLAEFQTQINENLEVINSPTSSIEQVTAARENLLNIQNQMIEAYGSEAAAVDALTDALNGQSDAFDTIAEAEYDKLRGEYIDQNTKWYRSDPFGNLVSDMENHSLLGFSDTYLKDLSKYKGFNKEIINALNKYGLNTTETLAQTSFWRKGMVVSASGNIYDMLDAFQELKSIDLSKYTEDEQQKITQNVDNIIAELQSVISEHKELYEGDILYKQINKDSALKKYYNDLVDAKQAYDDAFKSGNENSIDLAIAQYSKLYNQIESISKGDAGLQNYFENLFPTMDSLVDDWNFNDAIDKNINGLKAKLEDASEALENLSASEIKAWDESKKDLYSEDQVTALRALKDAADSYKVTLDDLVDTMTELGMVADDRYNNIFDQYLAPLEKGMSRSEIKDLAQWYQDELDGIAESGADVTKSIYGNIDTDNREILNWTEQNLNKYKDVLMEMEGINKSSDMNMGVVNLLGSDSPDIEKQWQKIKAQYKDEYSTLMGSSAEFDGVEIAFSPMLQTGTGEPELLSPDTVSKYIQTLVDEVEKEHPNGWDTDDLLALDTKGLTVDGKKIQKLIADVGKTARATGSQMHYAGKLGSFQNLKNQLHAYAEELGISDEQMEKLLQSASKLEALTPDELKFLYSIDNIGSMTLDEAIEKAKDLYNLSQNEYDITDRSNLNAFKAASEGSDHKDDYNSYLELMQKTQELYKAGEVGSEIFKAGAKAFSMNGMKDASNWVENYKELGKYFQEGSAGLETFVKGLESKKIAQWDEATKTWSIDLEDFAGVAKKMNMPVEMLAVLMDGLQQYGFTDDYFGTMEQGTEHLTDLTQQLVEERAKLSQMDKSENAYDEQEALVNSLQSRIKETAKSLADFYKDNGSAEDAYQKKLQERDDVLSSLETAYKNVSKSSGKAKEEALEALEPAITAAEQEYDIKIRVDEDGNFHILDDIDTINAKIAETETKLQQLKNQNGGKLDMDDSEVKQALSDYENLLRDKNLLEVPTIMRLDTSSLSKDAAATVDKVSDIIELLEEKDIQLQVNPEADVSKIQSELDEKLSGLSEDDLEILAKLGFTGNTPEEIVRSAMNTDSIEIPAELTLEGQNPIIAAIDETNRYLSAIAIKIGADTSGFEEGVDDAVDGAESKEAHIKVFTSNDDATLDNGEIYITATVTGDEDLAELQNQISNLPEGTTTVIIDAEADESHIQQVNDAINELKKNGNIEIQPSVNPIDIYDSINEALNVPGVASLNVTADTSEFDSGVEAAKETAESTPVNVKVSTSSDPNAGLSDGQVKVTATVTGEQDVNTLKNSLDNLPDGTKSVTVDVDCTDASQVEAVSSALDDFAQKTQDNYDVRGTVKLQGAEYAITTTDRVRQGVNSIPKKSNSTLSATDKATGTINSVKSALDGLRSKTITIVTRKITEETTTKSGKANGTFNAHATGTFNAHASGTNVSIQKDEDSLVNELGNEGLVRDGTLYEIPGGAQMIHLQRGDILFNHKQMSELKNNGYVTSNGGHGKLIGAFAEGTLNGISAYNSVLNLNSHGGTGNPTGTTGKKWGWDNRTSTSTSSSSSSKSSSSSNSSSSSSSSTDEYKQDLDEIAIKLDRIQRVTSTLDVKAQSTYRGWLERTDALKNEISEVTKEMEIQQQGYDRYLQQAESIGLSADWVSKIQNGEINIDTITDEDLYNKISEYQTWWKLFMPRINLFKCGNTPTTYLATT